jgi:hypothetical protein
VATTELISARVKKSEEKRKVFSENKEVSGSLFVGSAQESVKRAKDGIRRKSQEKVVASKCAARYRLARPLSEAAC